jgi:hypothetical protein
MATSVVGFQPEGRTGLRARRAVPLALGVAIVVLVAIGTASAWPAGSMVAAQPASASTGDLQWIRVFAIAQTTALVLFCAALLAIRRWSARTLFVVLIATIIQTVPLVAPLLLSNDAYGYWNAGRLASHAANPYVDVPAQHPDDPSFGYMSPAWRDEPTVYGPAFTALSSAVGVIAGDQAQVAALLFRATAAFAMVVLTLIVSRISSRASFAAAFVGWNPVFAFQFAGGGHNDVLVAALMVLGLWLGLQHRASLAGAAWAVSLFIKSLALVLLPLQFLEDRARRRPTFLSGFVLGTVVLAGLSTLAFGLAWTGSFVPVVETAMSAELRSVAIWPRLAAGLPELLIKIGPLVVFGIFYLVLIREAARGRARHGLTMGLFLVASPFLWTWYVITPAALAAAEDDPPALLVAMGLCAYTSLFLGTSGNVLEVLLG